MRSLILTVLISSVHILGCFCATPNTRLSFFDIDLLRSAAEEKTGNVVISPASVKSTLAMLLEGAEGNTATEIQIALRVPPVKKDFRKDFYLFLKALEVNSTNVMVRNANALFVSNKLKLKKEYESMVQNFYLAEVDKLDFSNPKLSVDTINRWVNNKTQGLIPTIANQDIITPYANLVLTNAIYFSGTWKYRFNVKSTRSECFYNNNVCRNVAMMDLQAELKYAFIDDLKSHALELPYQDDRYSMLLLVPQYQDAAVALIRDLPYIGIPQITDMMEKSDVILTMPKFTIDYSVELIEALQKLRINSLFSSLADLSGIFESGFASSVSSIYQSVHMKVDEMGTEAAAATISVVVPLINNQIQLRIDKPFLFFIRDNQLGINLFEGKIEEPTEFIDAIGKKGGQFKGLPIPLEPITKQSQPVILTSRRSTADLAGSSYSNFNQGDPIISTAQAKQSPTSQTPAPVTTPSDLNSKSTESQTPKSSGGIGGWFRKVFLGEN